MIRLIALGRGVLTVKKDKNVITRLMARRGSAECCDEVDGCE